MSFKFIKNSKFPVPAGRREIAMPDGRQGNCRRVAGKGSTLLLSMLIISVMMSSLYVLGSVALRHIRQISNTISGEAVILGSHAGMEQALWAHNRRVTEYYETDSYEGNCDASPATEIVTELSGTLTDVSTSYCKSNLMPANVLISVPVDEAGTPGAENVNEIYVYDPNNPDNDPPYNSLSLELISGEGNFYICPWQEIICKTGTAIWQNEVSPFTGSFGVSNYDRQKLVIRLENIGATDFVVEINSADLSTGPLGLPADYVTIKSKGQDAITSRHLESRTSP